MKLPNGYGSVHKLPGKRRNPYRARITKGFDENGKQIYATIGYYPTKSVALQALADYNSAPYDLQVNTITFTEVYNKWSEEHFTKIVPSAVRTWKAAYNYCKPLYNMRMRDIRVHHLEGAIKDADVGNRTKQRMKSLFNLMYKYALRHEIVDKDYAAMCNSVKDGERQIIRTPFTAEELQALWNNLDFPCVKMILIGIYSGWRPQELTNMLTSDVNISDGYMKGGSKTDAGKDRIVPIHPKVYDLVKSLYNPESKYLFTDEKGLHLTYDKYRARFIKVMKKIKSDHKPHDTRHTFVTAAKRCYVDEYCLKLMVGHAISDVTEKVYTHRQLEELKLEMQKIEM